MKITTQTKSSGAVAFTLIELLTVIAIIAILAAIILPVLSVATTHAKKVKAATEIAQIRAAIEQYESQYGRMPVSGPVQSSGMPNITYGGVYVNKAGTTWPDSSLYFNAQNIKTNQCYVTNNSDVIAILMNYTNYPDSTTWTVNTNYQKNPQQTKFLSGSMAPDSSSPGIGKDLQYRDPWGNPYIITMDLNEDDKAEDLFYKQQAIASSVGMAAPGGQGTMGLNYEGPSPTGDGNYAYHGNVMVWSMGPDGPLSHAPSSFDIPTTSTTPGSTDGANKQHIVSWLQ